MHENNLLIVISPNGKTFPCTVSCCAAMEKRVIASWQDMSEVMGTGGNWLEILLSTLFWRTLMLLSGNVFSQWGLLCDTQVCLCDEQNGHSIVTLALHQSCFLGTV